MLTISQKKRREGKIKITVMQHMADNYIWTLNMRLKELKEEQETKRTTQKKLRIER